jgi:hypothetical protein
MLPSVIGGPASRHGRSTVEVEHTKRGHTVSVSTTESSDGTTMSARDAYILETSNAWRAKDAGPEVFAPTKTRSMEDLPAGQRR